VALIWIYDLSNENLHRAGQLGAGSSDGAPTRAAHRQAKTIALPVAGLRWEVPVPADTENSATAMRRDFSIIIPDETVARAADYLRLLRGGQAQAGVFLQNRLRGTDLWAMTEYDLLGELLDTKPPQIFAESAVVGDGSDWSLTELSLLGDVSIAVPVTVFDDGNHHAPTPHAIPFAGTLIFTPGALLRNGQGHTPADWNEVIAQTANCPGRVTTTSTGADCSRFSAA